MIRKRLLGALALSAVLLGIISCGQHARLAEPLELADGTVAGVRGVNASSAGAVLPGNATEPSSAVIPGKSEAASASSTSSSTHAPGVTSPAAATPPGSASSVVPPPSSTSAAASADWAAADSGGRATSPPAATGAAAALPTLTPGLHPLTTKFGGLLRTWSLAVPPGPAPKKGRPLLIALHGVDGHGTDMRNLGFEPLSASSGFLVAYPDAWEGSWNDGRSGVVSVAHQQHIDDVGFLQALIDQAVAEAGADAHRVALLGFSNGAMMASRFACEAGTSLAAVALASGAGPEDLRTRCNPAAPLPVAVVFGTGDTVVPYRGGPIARHSGVSRGSGAAVETVLDIWLKRDGCTSTKETPVVFAPLKVVEVRGMGCTAGAVRHYRVEGGGHQWFDVAEFHATQTIWQFIAENMPPA